MKPFCLLATVFAVCCNSALAQEASYSIDTRHSGGSNRAEVIAIISGQAGQVRLSSSSLDHFLQYSQLLELQAIAANSAKTAERVASLEPLAKRIEELTEQVRVLNEEQLVAIQRAVVTRLDTLPLQMIDDEAVVAEIRKIAIEAVETEFDLVREEN